jgi:hypothetical protein
MKVRATEHRLGTNTSECGCRLSKWAAAHRRAGLGAAGPLRRRGRLVADLARELVVPAFFFRVRVEVRVGGRTRGDLDLLGQWLSTLSIELLDSGQLSGARTVYVSVDTSINRNIRRMRCDVDSRPRQTAVKAAPRRPKGRSILAVGASWSHSQAPLYVH